ncbi:hypothetical protein FAIPA1_40019 [Frankia sp. AiPs1]
MQRVHDLAGCQPLGQHDLLTELLRPEHAAVLARQRPGRDRRNIPPHVQHRQQLVDGEPARCRRVDQRFGPDRRCRGNIRPGTARRGCLRNHIAPLVGDRRDPAGPPSAARAALREPGPRCRGPVGKYRPLRPDWRVASVVGHVIGRAVAYTKSDKGDQDGSYPTLYTVMDTKVDTEFMGVLRGGRGAETTSLDPRVQTRRGRQADRRARLPRTAAAGDLPPTGPRA